MIRQGARLLHKRVFNKFSTSLITSQPRFTPQFSTKFNKQFNDEKKLNTPLTFESLSREQFVQNVERLKQIISSDLSTPPIFEIDQLMAKNRTEHPNDPLPKQMLVTLLDDMDHYYSFYLLISNALKQDVDGVIENIEEMKAVAISKLLKWTHLNIILEKAIYQEWFNIEDLKSSMPEVLMGIDIDGKDFVYHDQVNYYTSLVTLSSSECWNVEHEPTRDSLIGYLSLICLKVPMLNQKELALNIIQSFVEYYPIVKKKYTTPYSGNINQSWTNVLEKVYSEDEFDWFLDIETDLPIHMGGMYNICKEYLKVYGESRTPNNFHSLVQVLKEESLRAPNNPYIPHFKIYSVNNYEGIDECLKILAKSNPNSRFEDLKRIESFGIFKNQKPSKPRIKDFKFFPMLALKLKVLQGNSSDLQQVEYYSRLPSHFDLITMKFLSNAKEGRLEEALEIYLCLSHIENAVPPQLMLHLSYFAAKPMISLGYHNECIQLIERFKNKYHDSSAEWERLLQLAKEEIEKTKNK